MADFTQNFLPLIVHPPAHVFRHVNVVASLEHPRLAKHLLPILELLEGDHYRPAADDVRAGGEAGGRGHHQLSLDRQACTQDIYYLPFTFNSFTILYWE